MLIALWIITALSCLLWSLGAWGLHTLLSLDASRIADLKPLIDQLPERLPYAAFIDAWIPGWREMLKFSVDLMQNVLGWIGGAATPVVWTVWALGMLMLLGLAAVATWGIRSLSRQARQLATGSAVPGNR